MLFSTKRMFRKNQLSDFLIGHSVQGNVLFCQHTAEISSGHLLLGSVPMTDTPSWSASGFGNDTPPSYPDTEVLLLDGYRWRTVQRLPARGASGLDLTMADGVPHLLVVNR